MNKTNKYLPFVIVLIIQLEVIFFSIIQKEFEIRNDNILFMAVWGSIEMSTASYLFWSISLRIKNKDWRNFFKFISILICIVTAFTIIIFALY